MLGGGGPGGLVLYWCGGGQARCTRMHVLRAAHVVLSCVLYIGGRVRCCTCYPVLCVVRGGSGQVLYMSCVVCCMCVGGGRVLYCVCVGGGEKTGHGQLAHQESGTWGFIVRCVLSVVHQPQVIHR